MGVSTIDAHFHWKPVRVEDLDCVEQAKPCRVEVARMIELNQAQFQHFSAHMLHDMPFIAANRDLMREAAGVQCCLLVYDRDRSDGILVQSEGYDYARYAAYVHHRSDLDLRDVIVDHYNLKVREPRSGRER